jgi:hypothetical protein
MAAISTSVSSRLTDFTLSVSAGDILHSGVVVSSDRAQGEGIHFLLVQSSSHSRRAASLSGFFDFSQVLDGPLR